MKEIASGVVIETDYEGVTIGSVQTPNGVIMIDAPISMKDAQIWRSCCSRTSGISDRLLVLLDEHFDRCIGARALRCPIIAHEKTAQAIAGRNSASKPQSSRTGAIWESSAEVSSIHWAHPEITFTNTMNINWDEEPLVLEYHPGPSRGSTWAVLPERKVAFIGDTVIANQPPFLAAADLEAWNDSLELLKDNDYKDFILISGRGALVNKDDVRDLQKFLKKAQRLADKYSNGKADLSQIENAGASLASEFKPRNKAESEVFSTRLAFGFSQYCLNYLSKKNNS
jgi:glyoxylase-like metal-dependent hydrolase (beta-lactamase superfamily II)